jgi:hypothetical protein
MSLLGPVTNAERAGWQRRAARALVTLLDAAAKHDLPVLTWQVSGSRLVGRCLDLDMTARRQDFERWCAFLGAVDRWPEHEVHGVRHLHATRRHGWGPDGRVEVVVLADLHADADHDHRDADEA